MSRNDKVNRNKIPNEDMKIYKNGLQNVLNDSNSTLTNAEQNKRMIELIGNEKKDDLNYLNAHPELRAITNLIFKNLEKRNPPNILEFCANYFRQPEAEIANKILEELEHIAEKSESLNEYRQLSPMSSNEL